LFAEKSVLSDGFFNDVCLRAQEGSRRIAALAAPTQRPKRILADRRLTNDEGRVKLKKNNSCSSGKKEVTI